MYNEGAPEFVIDQGMYYPSVANNGYIYTGLESTGDWDDHHRVLGVDGQNIQYIGSQTESMPYVYYTPTYAYAQSPYNPYNPYIPGAMIGSDGSYVGAQPYYVLYENGVSSPAYYPMVGQPGQETYTSSTIEQYRDMAASTANRVDSSGYNSNSSSTGGTFAMNLGRGVSNHTIGKGSDGFKSNGGPKKSTLTNGGVTFNSVSGPASSQIMQGQGTQAVDKLSNRKTVSVHNQLKVTSPFGNGLSNFGSSGKTTNDPNANPNSLGEQNRGPKTSTSNSRLTVKAYSTRAGNSDEQGNISISMDSYNKDDFPIEYVNAKFYVIKSYSEDDVHKSIKYNVWSSTPNGNKKLNSAYEEAQKISVAESKACPIFLFFSVNASGQFCGVAEMTGHVEFQKDMDFWQQDKWSGSFPVTWRIIKDVPNPHFRHIILENNEYKPVTNSRDTQEIKYKKGIEMLKVFKNYVSKTSILDDFMYYENRERLLQEEKARLLIKSYVTPIYTDYTTGSFGLGSIGDEKSGLNKYINPSMSVLSVAVNDNKQVVDEKPTENDVLRFRALAITSPDKTEIKPVEKTVSNESSNVLTVGSMPVKVNGLGESSDFLTVGTIPLDPKALKVKEAGASSTKGTVNKG